MSNSHKGSRLGTIDKVIPIDYSCNALFHYDITNSEVIRGIEPIDDITTLRRYDGKFGGAVAIDQGATNLLEEDQARCKGRWHSQVNEDTDVSVTLGKDGEDKLEIVATNFQGWGGGARAYIQSFSSLEGKTITFSVGKIFIEGLSDNGFVRIMLEDNLDGTSSSSTYIRENGYHYYPSITREVRSGGISSFAAIIRIYDDSSRTIRVSMEEPMVEEGDFHTSFTIGTRQDGTLSYPISLLNHEEGTLSFWAKLPYSLPFVAPSTNYLYMSTGSGYGGDQSLNFRAFNNSSYPDRIIGIHWAGDDGTQNHFNVSLNDVPTYHNGEWNMYTITWKQGSGYKLYINGSFIGGAGTTLAPFMEDRILIRYIMLDEMRIDNVEKEGDEIYSWYVSNSPFFPKGIHRVAY